MSKNNFIDDDFDWEDDSDFDDREAEKNKNKNKQANRKLDVKRRMDDYLESRHVKSHDRYLDLSEDFSYD